MNEKDLKALEAAKEGEQVVLAHGTYIVKNGVVIQVDPPVE